MRPDATKLENLPANFKNDIVSYVNQYAVQGCLFMIGLGRRIPFIRDQHTRQDVLATHGNRVLVQEHTSG